MVFLPYEYIYDLSNVFFHENWSYSHHIEIFFLSYKIWNEVVFHLYEYFYAFSNLLLIGNSSHSRDIESAFLLYEWVHAF